MLLCKIWQDLLIMKCLHNINMFITAVVVFVGFHVAYSGKAFKQHKMKFGIISS